MYLNLNFLDSDEQRHSEPTSGNFNIEEIDAETRRNNRPHPEPSGYIQHEVGNRPLDEVGEIDTHNEDEAICLDCVELRYIVPEIEIIDLAALQSMEAHSVS